MITDRSLSWRNSRYGMFVVLVLFAVCGATHPNAAIAAGALAVGLPADVAKGGFTYGYQNDKSGADQARAAALQACRTTKDAANNAKLRSLCKVVEVYDNRCVAVAMDPGAGTPGVGWAVADDVGSAEKQALSACKATAGQDRAEACVISHSQCDGTAK